MRKRSEIVVYLKNWNDHLTWNENVNTESEGDMSEVQPEAPVLTTPQQSNMASSFRQLDGLQNLHIDVCRDVRVQ